MKSNSPSGPGQTNAGMQENDPGRVIIATLDSLRGLRDREFVAVNWFPVGQELIQTFAEVTGDRQWIHVDVERARTESPYRSTIAHGFLTLSLLSSFMESAIDLRLKDHFAVNYGLDRVRFPAPVRAGDMIRARFQLRSLVETQGGYKAMYTATVDVKGASKPCCVADWIVNYSPSS